ncbi:PEP/pyruvate-binding domain-containing protein [Glutamicibacter sp. PS]|uniref:PEP/pyruvate-binding domain-containing protein n=1 Tax=Glutamicibacter sp. PS TaxID=3075634 RepID=UPI00283FAE8E|nr:PEP/pyruvate-binding domain-containing protein [Glutamicibacter sp. PS]MDR4532038.1 PEP-utilizing enzyme [Glutamicibacter sp. PS]
MDLIELANATDMTLVGGKATGLAALIAAGEKVPAGFVITTRAYQRDELPEAQILHWWATHCGGQPVAVRSSATAEDLDDASFAGLQDTTLGVREPDELLEAIRSCWSSLTSERASAYRERMRPGTPPPMMAVVVQQMVDASVAGVLFTADPLTGLRSRQVVDAVAGLGDAVVQGTVEADHATLDDGQVPQPIGCLRTAHLEELQRAGRRIEAALGSEQDIEFAFDHEGTLWLLQSRAITTLYPLPATDDGQLHVYLEVGHMQGLRNPVTPMGAELLSRAVTAMGGAFSDVLERMMVFAGGRMYLDMTFMFRSDRMRQNLPQLFEIYGSDPRVAEQLMEHPELQARRAPLRARLRAVPLILRLVALAPSTLTGVIRALLQPEWGRRRAFQAPILSDAPHGESLEDVLNAAEQAQDLVMRRGMWQMLPALYGGLAAAALAEFLLRGIAEPGEMDLTKGGMPHNPTTGMDLQLWQLAQRVRAHEDLFADREPEDLASQWRQGALPAIGLEDFLARFGHRCAQEVDAGIARWREDPAPVFAAITGYLQLQDLTQAPDARFARAAAVAESTIDELERRARAQGRTLRGAAAKWLLRRSRRLAGLREWPKFAWVQSIEQGRNYLLELGERLVQRDVLEATEDIFYLELDQARRAVAGESQMEAVASARASYEREMRRVRVPAVLLSDGSTPESTPEMNGATIRGRAAAPGRVTGPARVVTDPRTARVLPGEILVAPTTDPGWTPLFMTAAGLVSETGSPMAHGPTVAREYGIPAVIGITDATHRIATGDMLSIDGTHGTVEILDSSPVGDGA